MTGHVVHSPVHAPKRKAWALVFELYYSTHSYRLRNSVYHLPSVSSTLIRAKWYPSQFLPQVTLPHLPEASLWRLKSLGKTSKTPPLVISNQLLLQSSPRFVNVYMYRADMYLRVVQIVLCIAAKDRFEGRRKGARWWCHVAWCWNSRWWRGHRERSWTPN